MKVGFIGTGSMGSILIEALIQSRALEAHQIIASNRSKYKVERLAQLFPGLRAAETNKEVASAGQIVFVCVKPFEFKKVVDDIRDVVSSTQIVVCITSPVFIKQLEDSLSCKVAKIIPSITNYAQSGATICIYGQRMTPEDRELLDDLLRNIGEPLHISEQYTRVTSDISSCGPAFVSFFVQKFVEAAVQETGIPYEEAVRLAGEMVLGTGKLLTSGVFTPDTLQQRVAVPGGITAAALHLLEKELDGVFNELIRTTHAKFNEDLEKVDALFCGQKVD